MFSKEVFIFDIQEVFNNYFEFAAIEDIDAPERDRNKPVVTSNQILILAALRRLSLSPEEAIKCVRLFFYLIMGNCSKTNEHKNDCYLSLVKKEKTQFEKNYFSLKA